ncbi:hypothetical protein [Mycobacterium celatum]|uniref:Uncharacterized protein n=1 Tax=Mycobacterium celatum TaxID=28045 RepID=A0A1X1RMH6_MYCCE|nr:hypothetical protein [Mycobacterium celatum]ORV09366.1 hypothetical protein AWB95_17825 [Mycobacterium celatum]PIB73674.1 hypothetical protein CQY23_22755 [Mycobacterium celatum]
MITTYLTIIAMLMFVLFPVLIPAAVTLAPKTSAGARRIVSGVAGWQQALGRTIGWQRPARRFAV